MVDRTTFESLPDDVIYEVFKYFSMEELNDSFVSLNSRYDSILSQCKHLKIVVSNPDNIFYRVRQDFIYEHASTLIVEHPKSFHESIHQRILLNIRSLILAKPTRLQWDFINASLFPNLQRLHLLDSIFTYRTEKLCQLIFSSTFSQLHTCSLPHVPYDKTNHWQTSQTLRVLDINVMNIRVYERILLSCPNLLKFRIKLNENYDQISTLSLTSLIQHRCLRILWIIPMNPITCDFIEYFLRFVPSLESLTIKTADSRPSHIPLVTLSELLLQRTPHLRRIRLNFSLTDELRRNERLMKNDHHLLREYEVRFNLHQPWSLIVNNRC